MAQEQIGIYLEALADLSERQIHFAFDRALKSCMFIPKIPELRSWADEGAAIFQRQDAEKRTKLITGRPDKPQDWSRLDSVWEEIERRADEQERRDLAYIEPIPDDVIEKAIAEGRGYPGKDRGVDWARRKAARDRQAKGLPRPRIASDVWAAIRAGSGGES